MDVSKYRNCNGLNRNFPEFINDKKLRPYSKEFTDKFINMLKNNEHFSLVKYGDGELTNMVSKNENDHNCDGNFYFSDLASDLIRSYIFYLKDKSSYICRWDHVYDVQDIIDEDFKEFFNTREKFVEYNVLIHKQPFRSEQISFFKEIQKSKFNKMYISNKKMLETLCPLMKINIGIIIPESNSYLHRENITKTILENLTKDTIVLVSAGMYAKVLICELKKQRPDNTYIDVGSTFDGLFKATRDYNCIKGYGEELLKVYSS